MCGYCSFYSLHCCCRCCCCCVCVKHPKGDKHPLKLHEFESTIWMLNTIKILSNLIYMPIKRPIETSKLRRDRHTHGVLICAESGKIHGDKLRLVIQKKKLRIFGTIMRLKCLRCLGFCYIFRITNRHQNHNSLSNLTKHHKNSFIGSLTRAARSSFTSINSRSYDTLRHFSPFDWKIKQNIFHAVAFAPEKTI